MVIKYIILFLSSGVLALIITPFVRQSAIKRGLLDYPDEERRIHKKGIPRTGGIAIVISFFVAVILGYALFRPELRGSDAYLIGIFAGGAIIFIVGVWDDIRRISARKKLAGQIAAALALIPFGFFIHELRMPYAGTINLVWEFGVPFTMFWVIGIINTINFVDGVDGLAAGIAIIVSAALFIVSVATNQMTMAIMCVLLAGSTLGFLRYNFHPATIFMGDCGAMFLGFMLAAISIKVVFLNTSIVSGSFIPVLIFGLPIVDASWAILRRLRRRQSPFHADHFHTHHRLMDLGFSQRKTALTLYAFSLLCVTSGIIIALTNSERLAIILSAFLLVLSLIGIMLLDRASPSSPPPKSSLAQAGNNPRSVTEEHHD